MIQFIQQREQFFAKLLVSLVESTALTARDFRGVIRGYSFVPQRVMRRILKTPEPGMHRDSFGGSIKPD